MPGAIFYNKKLLGQVDETDFVVFAKHGGYSFGEVPGFAVLGRDYDFTGPDIDKTAPAFQIAEDGQAVARTRLSGDPAQLFRGVSPVCLVPEAHGVVAINAHYHIGRQGAVKPFCSSVVSLTESYCIKDADQCESCAKQPHAHLPGGVEDGFQVNLHG